MVRATCSRILMEDEKWTPFPNSLFEDELKDLRQNHSAAVYVVMYDIAAHKSRHVVNATVADLSRWVGLDHRVVRSCLKELERNHLILLEKGSISRSSRRTPRWGVAHANLDRRNGQWFPVPRFVRRYIRAYPNSILLVALLRIQHLKWLNDSWVGPSTLTKQLGWSETRIRDALRTMSDSKRWKALKTGLPRPLTREPRESEWGYGMVMHNHVRLVRYERDKKSLPTVRPAKLFARRFKTPILKPQRETK
jgi:hypothetical protein